MFDDYSTDAASEAGSEARSIARAAETQVELMKSDINRLLVITEGLWTLLKRAHGYTDEELRNVLTEIEQADKNQTLLCPECKRVVTSRQKACIYCGQVLLHDPFAR